MEPELVLGSAADLDDLRPLWLLLHRHHQQLLPGLAPYVSDEQSWSSRRRLYAQLLARPDSILLLARLHGALVGYGLAHVQDAAQTWVEDTWATGPRIGEIESLGVVPEQRGQGVGTALLDELLRRLGEAGADDVVLGVVPGNPATRLYERAGFTPTWSYLSRFAGRPAR